MTDQVVAAPAAEPVQEVAPEAVPAQEVQEGEVPVAPVTEAKEELKQEVKAQIKKLKIKVDGKELDKELDLANEAELIKMLQMAEMSGKRAQEAAELRKSEAQRNKELDSFLNTLKTNPEFILAQLGVDPAKFAESVLEKEVQKMQLTPEQRKIQDLENELKAIKDKEENAKKEAEALRAQTLRDKYAADYQNQLLSALDKGRIPNDPHTISKLADYMSIAVKNGIDLSFDELIPLYKEQQKSIIKQEISGLPVEEILSLLSDQMVQDIVVKKMPKEKKVAPPTAQSVKETATQGDKDGVVVRKRTESAADFFRNLGR